MRQEILTHEEVRDRLKSVLNARIVPDPQPGIKGIKEQAGELSIMVRDFKEQINTVEWGTIVPQDLYSILEELHYCQGVIQKLLQEPYLHLHK